jgi:hypothetical protein
VSRAASRTEWVPRPLALLAIAAVAVAVVVHSTVGFRGAYLTYGSGVWLSLARDLSGGVLYRDLVGELGFGGTRYFPLFFSAIAFVHAVGLSLLASGWLVGSAAAFLLLSGALRLSVIAGAPRLTAAMFAAAVIAPYFVWQTTFEVRADVLSAAFNVWGVALLVPAFRREEATRRFRLWPVAGCFMLAIATKITSVGVPLGVLLALILTRRLRLAGRFSAHLGAQLLGFFALVQLLSGGRALRVWSVCLFAGSDATGIMTALLSAGFLTGLANSHLVLVVGAVAIVTLVVMFSVPAPRDANAPAVPAIAPASIWAAASATLALNLSSPGTVPSNQLPEWIAFSLLLPVFLGDKPVAVRRALAGGIAVLVIWMAGQNFARAAERRPVVTAERMSPRRDVVSRLEEFPAPILSESAVWPILANREVVMPDPFAARIVFRARPEIERQLIDQITQRRYSAILLEFDPLSAEGRRMYGFAHFSMPVIAAIRSYYQPHRLTTTEVFVFVPRTASTSVDSPGRY